MTDSPSPARERAAELLRSQAGDELERALSPIVYSELKKIARGLTTRERRGHSLNATALVHEAYLRLIDGEEVTPEDCRRFYAIAARSMRQVLVDHARSRNAGTRRAAGQRVSLGGLSEKEALSTLDILALEEAMQRLTALDERKGRVVELRFFAAMPFTDIADLLGVSKATVIEDWAMARTWLEVQLDPG